MALIKILLYHFCQVMVIHTHIMNKITDSIEEKHMKSNLVEYLYVCHYVSLYELH